MGADRRPQRCRPAWSRSHFRGRRNDGRAPNSSGQLRLRQRFTNWHWFFFLDGCIRADFYSFSSGLGRRLWLRDDGDRPGTVGFGLFAKVSFHLLCKLTLNGAGMRVLIRNPKTFKVVDDRFGFDLELAGQFVNSHLSQFSTERVPSAFPQLQFRLLLLVSGFAILRRRLVRLRLFLYGFRRARRSSWLALIHHSRLGCGRGHSRFRSYGGAFFEL